MVKPWDDNLSHSQLANTSPATYIKFMNKNDFKNLTPEQYNVVCESGTERPFSSPLYTEKRKGQYVCVACGTPLFSSETKYESGTGWPSFYKAIDENIGTKEDRKMLSPRVEYHCAKCGGHQGHVFNDGPNPTGLRYCNNGVALTFIPDEE